MPKWKAPAAITRVWLMRGVGAVGVILLAAVPALGLTMLSPGLFPTRPAAEKVSPTDPEVVVTYGPLTFDAPTTTLQSVKASEPGSRPPSIGGRTQLLPPNRLTASRTQVSGGEGSEKDRIVLPETRFFGGRSTPSSLQQTPAASVSSPSAPRKAGEKASSSGSKSAASGGSPGTDSIGMGGALVSGASSLQSTNAGDRQPRTQRQGKEYRLQPLAVTPSGPNPSGEGESLEPLDSDLSKRKPRKPRKSPHK